MHQKLLISRIEQATAQSLCATAQSLGGLRRDQARLAVRRQADATHRVSRPSERRVDGMPGSRSRSTCSDAAVSGRPAAAPPIDTRAPAGVQSSPESATGDPFPDPERTER